MAMRRISWRASRSASSVTVQVFTMTTLAANAEVSWSCRSVKQFLLDGGAFGLRSPAAEIRDEETLRGHQPFGPISEATFWLFSATVISSFAL